MGFKLRSGNSPSFKSLGGSTMKVVDSPFHAEAVADKAKEAASKVTDVFKGKGGGGPKISLKGKGGGTSKPKINLKGKGGGSKPKVNLSAKGKASDAGSKIKEKMAAKGKTTVTKKTTPTKTTKPTKTTPTKNKPDSKSKPVEKKTEKVAPKTPEKAEVKPTTGKMTDAQMVDNYATKHLGVDQKQLDAGAEHQNKSFIDRHKDKAQKYLNVAANVPGPIGKAAGLGSAAIDYRDAFKAWQAGDTDLMKKELLSGTTSAVFSGLPGTSGAGNIIKNEAGEFLAKQGANYMTQKGGGMVAKAVVKKGVKEGGEAIIESDKQITDKISENRTKGTSRHHVPRFGSYGKV